MSATGPFPFGPGGAGPGRPDPAAAFAAAIRDFWTFGAAMMQSAAAGGAPRAGGQDDAFRTMAAPAAGALDAYAEFMARLAGKGPQDPLAAAEGAARQAIDLSPALVQAGQIAMGSALRYGQGLAELFARHQANLAKAVATRLSGDAVQPPEQCRVAAEELRAFLRDVGETAMLEARRLEHELAQLSEAVAQAVAPSAPDDPHRRRWTVKP